MPINESDVQSLREEKGTPGGTTYHIITKSDLTRTEQPLCYRMLHGQNGTGMRCSRPAGMSTDHYGTGACRLHGGITNLVPLKTGGSAFSTRSGLHDKIEEFLIGDMSDLSDLSLELASARALFREQLEDFPESSEDTYGISLARLLKTLAAIGTLLEKISKIEARNTLTSAQALLLQVTVADILLKNIPDVAVRERAVRELTNRMTGVSIGERFSPVVKEDWTVDNTGG